MSLTMMALRIAAVHAVRAAGTIVGDNVLDSQIGAIDVTADGGLTSDNKKPFVAVYTDAAKADDLGGAGLRTNGQVDIVFNCGVSMLMGETDPENGVSLVAGIPATDCGFEAILDVLDAQILRALVDPDNPWAQVFGQLVQGYLAKEHVRSSSAVENVRLAVGQVKLTVDVLADPAPDQALVPGGVWARFLELLAVADPVSHEMFETVLETGVDGGAPALERLLAITSGDLGELQLGPVEGVSGDVVFSGES